MRTQFQKNDNSVGNIILATFSVSLLPEAAAMLHFWWPGVGEQC